MRKALKDILDFLELFRASFVQIFHAMDDMRSEIRLIREKLPEPKPVRPPKPPPEAVVFSEDQEALYECGKIIFKKNGFPEDETKNEKAAFIYLVKREPLNIIRAALDYIERDVRYVQDKGDYPGWGKICGSFKNMRKNWKQLRAQIPRIEALSKPEPEPEQVHSRGIGREYNDRDYEGLNWEQIKAKMKGEQADADD